MKPYSYQAKIINEDPLIAGLWLGCGTGKTFVALSLAEGNVLVVAPKTIRDDQVWERQLGKMNSKVTFLKVISKEEFRRDWESLPKFNTTIFDESHTVCGLTANTRSRARQEYPRASQIFEAVHAYLKRTKPKRVYLCTASHVKNPMAVLAAAWLLGREWDFYNWRQTFMVKIPMPGRREIWTPRKDSETKDRLARAVQSLGYVGRLSDFADVPEQTHITKHTPLTSQQEKALKELPMLYPDPIVLIGKKHQVEQGVLTGDEFSVSQAFETGKIEAILELKEEYEKILVFAKYTLQIELIASELTRAGIKVYTLTGATKDRGAMIKEAEESDNCVVVCQSQISAGYELPSFRCTVFASESWSYVDCEQAIGRTLRMNRLEKNLYVYLVSGTIDKAVREALFTKKDFSERVYLKL